MENFVYLIVGLFCGWGGGILLSQSIPTWTGWLLLGLGVLLLALYAKAKRLWPNRKEWNASLLDSPTPLNGYKTTNWRTDRPLQVGDSFILDIRKPNGKGRVINRIWFMRGNYSAAEFPNQIAVTLSGKNGILAGYDRKLLNIDFHNIDINLSPNLEVRFITIEVISTSPNKYWAVGDIRIQEVRLFNKFWKRDIE